VLCCVSKSLNILNSLMKKNFLSLNKFTLGFATQF
jgi:hypothetical protein